MLARVQSYLLQGIDALPCEVEVDFDLADTVHHAVVGLPDAAVKESIERMNSALVNSGYPFPRGRMLVNLAPADVRKEGPLYDLPIAVGYLITQGVISGTRPQASSKDRSLLRRANETDGGAPAVDVRQMVLAGELALDGRVRPIKGAIAMAALAAEKGARGVIVPAENAAEAAVVPGVEVIGVRTLAEVVGILNGQLDAAPHPTADIEGMLRTAAAPVDFVEIRGQEAVKRAIVIAAAGSHNILGLWARARSARGPRRPVSHNLLGLWSRAWSVRQPLQKVEHDRSEPCPSKGAKRRSATDHGRASARSATMRTFSSASDYSWPGVARVEPVCTVGAPLASP
jgi:magnesium chelatase family protein